MTYWNYDDRKYDTYEEAREACDGDLGCDDVEEAIISLDYSPYDLWEEMLIPTRSQEMYHEILEEALEIRASTYICFIEEEEIE